MLFLLFRSGMECAYSIWTSGSHFPKVSQGEDVSPGEFAFVCLAGDPSSRIKREQNLRLVSLRGNNTHRAPCVIRHTIIRRFLLASKLRSTGIQTPFKAFLIWLLP